MKRADLLIESIGKISAEIAGDREKDKQIDDLKNKNWFDNPATLIALAAFLLSFATSIVTLKHTTDQDNHDLQTELRTVLQRVASLPIDQAKFKIDHPIDPNDMTNVENFAILDSLTAQQINTLAQQAFSIVNRLDEDAVTATDYIAIAEPLVAAQDFRRAHLMLDIALAKSGEIEDALAARTIVSNLYYREGKIPEGRKSFGATIAFISAASMISSDQKSEVIGRTYCAWAESELISGDKVRATEQLDMAQAQVEKISTGRFRQNLERKIFQIKGQLL